MNDAIDQLRHKLNAAGLRKLAQPASPGAVFCECGRAKVRVRPGRHGMVCEYCARCEAANREMNRRSADTSDNEMVFNPTPSPYCEAWRWTVAR